MESDCNLLDGFDPFRDIAFEQLLDIRDCASYKIQTLLYENKQKIDFDVNDYDQFTDEKQRKITISTGILLGLQLRQIIENSFKEFNDFFMRIKMLSEL